MSPLDLSRVAGIKRLSDILYSDNPRSLVTQLVDNETTGTLFDARKLVAPVDRQEIWAAGVTYKRSKIARESESEGAASFYDKVYTAPRPEIFFKSPAWRVVGPGDAVRVRRDSHWSVPEPEIALFISPALKIVGYSIGNDMSARDIEGENPLYLPQAKIYDGSCALGPVVTLAADFPTLDQATIRLKIERDGRVVFEGETSLASMARTFDSLVEWLAREITFPDGVVLLTGTGIVPPDEFTLKSGDLVTIDAAGIGSLVNPVA
jgi:2-dehydro-3-deoxy-D-arabinonate dehydratase